MIAAVNRFNEACGLEQRVRADSHIALHEAFPGAGCDQPPGYVVPSDAGQLPAGLTGTEHHHGLAFDVHQVAFFQVLEHAADHLP